MKTEKFIPPSIEEHKHPSEQKPKIDWETLSEDDSEIILGEDKKDPDLEILPAWAKDAEDVTEHTEIVLGEDKKDPDLQIFEQDEYGYSKMSTQKLEESIAKARAIVSKLGNLAVTRPPNPKTKSTLSDAEYKKKFIAAEAIIKMNRELDKRLDRKKTDELDDINKRFAA